MRSFSAWSGRDALLASTSQASCSPGASLHFPRSCRASSASASGMLDVRVFDFPHPPKHSRRQNISRCLARQVEAAVLPAVSASKSVDGVGDGDPPDIEGPPAPSGQGKEHQQHEPQSDSDFRALLQLLKSHQESHATPSGALCNQKFRGALQTGRGQWKDVWECYQLVEAMEIKLERTTYTMIWERAAHDIKLDMAYQVFRRMGDVHGCPDQREYVTIISRLLKARKKRGLPHAQLAYECWHELRKAWGPMMDEVSWRAGVNACVEVGKLDEALKIIQRMRANNLRPGRGSYNMIIKYHCKSGDMDAARQVLRDRHQNGFYPDLYSFNTLIDGYVQAGDMEMARAVLDRAGYEGLQPDVISFSTYINGCAKTGNLKEARKTLDEMTIIGVTPNVYTYSGILESHIKCGDMDGAEEMLQSMHTHGVVRPNAVMYNALIRAYGKQENLLGYGHCLRLLQEMKDRNVAPGVDTYSTLMDAAVKGGMGKESVLDLLVQLKAVGLEPDAVVWTTLMKMHQMQGTQNEAAGPFTVMATSMNTYADLKNEAAGPLIVMATSVNTYADSKALNMLVHVYASSGNMEAAEAATIGAARFAHNRGLKPPVESFGALIVGYHRLGQLQPLLTTFRRFLRLGGTPHERMAEVVVKACLRYGDPKTALKAIRAMQLAGVDDACFERCRELVFHHELRLDDGEGGDSGDDGDGGKGKKEDAMWFERLKWFVGLPNKYYEASWP
eukprot:gene11512-34225_t